MIEKQKKFPLLQAEIEDLHMILYNLADQWKSGETFQSDPICGSLLNRYFNLRRQGYE